MHFSSVGDLNTGAWVRKSGLKVGSVTRIEPAEDEKTIIVTLTFSPGQVVRTTDKFALVSKGILGDMYIEQKPGPKDSSLARKASSSRGPRRSTSPTCSAADAHGMVDRARRQPERHRGHAAEEPGTMECSLKDIAKTAENVRIVTRQGGRRSPDPSPT